MGGSSSKLPPIQNIRQVPQGQGVSLYRDIDYIL